MPTADLLRRIRLGEDSALELKSVEAVPGRVSTPGRDELAAFANGRGGCLLLGVHDKTRSIRGIPLNALDTVEGWVREVCNDSVKPALDADILKLELEDANGQLVPVLRIDVERSLFVHRSPGGYFRRIGSSKREMPPDVLARLFQECSQSRVIRFDESNIPRTGRADLDYALTQRFLRADAADEDLAPEINVPGAENDTLRKLRIVATAADGRLRLTLAGRCSVRENRSNGSPMRTYRP